MTNESLEEVGSAAYFVIRAAEPWEQQYLDNQTTFKKLVRAEGSLEYKVLRYFRELYHRLNRLIDMNEYRRQAIKAYDVVVKVDNTAFKDEVKIMLSVMLDDLTTATSAGVESAIALYSPAYPISSMDAEIARSVDTIGLQDVTGIIENTRELMKTSLQTSIDIGETDQQAMARLKTYIENPARALMIARTESVRAYSAGIISFGRTSGAEGKTWHTVPGACLICEPNAEKTVGIDENFPSGDFAPPAHPNCRCSVSLTYPPGGIDSSGQ